MPKGSLNQEVLGEESWIAYKINNSLYDPTFVSHFRTSYRPSFRHKHGLRTPNEGLNQKYLKNWPDVVDEICFGST